MKHPEGVSHIDKFNWLISFDSDSHHRVSRRGRHFDCRSDFIRTSTLALLANLARRFLTLIKGYVR